MSEVDVQPAAEAPGLTQLQRLTCTFTAPSKTFEDIKRGNKSWWLPFIVSLVIGYVFFAAVTQKIGWSQVAENVIHFSPKAEDRMAQLPPDQKATIMNRTAMGMEYTFVASPITVLLFALVVAVVLWGTINFVFGGKATFSNVFVVWMYAALPWSIKSILGTIVIYAGLAPESFNLNNFAPTSAGAFLNPMETNAGLYKLASAIDFTMIWYLMLFGIGLSIVAGVKRSAGYIAVFGWWALIVLIGAGWAAAFS